jgi:hypothetical protein
MDENREKTAIVTIRILIENKEANIFKSLELEKQQNFLS